eukprot:scaffold156306_cov34-Prasinocladus_malaysianus.AAC.1
MSCASNANDAMIAMMIAAASNAVAGYSSNNMWNIAQMSIGTSIVNHYNEYHLGLKHVCELPALRSPKHLMGRTLFDGHWLARRVVYRGLWRQADRPAAGRGGRVGGLRTETISISWSLRGQSSGGEGRSRASGGQARGHGAAGHLDSLAI